jgi:hypothetical protein
VRVCRSSRRELDACFFGQGNDSVGASFGDVKTNDKGIYRVNCVLIVLPDCSLQPFLEYQREGTLCLLGKKQ